MNAYLNKFSSLTVAQSPTTKLFSPMIICWSPLSYVMGPPLSPLLNQIITIFPLRLLTEQIPLPVSPPEQIHPSSWVPIFAAHSVGVTTGTLNLSMMFHLHKTDVNRKLYLEEDFGCGSPVCCQAPAVHPGVLPVESVSVRGLGETRRGVGVQVNLQANHVT